MRVCGACTALCTKTKRILVVKRSQEVTEPGTWAAVGGHIEDGEEPRVGIIREFKEEVGYDIDKMIIVSTIEREDMTFHNGTSFHEEEFDVTLNWENDEAQWLTLDEALEKPDIMEAYKHFLESRAFQLVYHFCCV